MRSFNYAITDEVEIHARPVGMLAKEAKQYEAAITIKKGEKKADAGKLMALMGLGIKCGEEIIVEAEGADEEVACAAIEVFFKANL